MSRILIIDDDQDICLVLHALLSKSQFEVDTAHTGADGLQQLQTIPYDLVISDYTLPDLTGAELLQRIKTLKPTIAIIVITGYSDVGTAVEAFRYGASDFVTKPLYPDEFLITIKEVLVKNKLRLDTLEESSLPNNHSQEISTDATRPTSNFVIGISAPSQLVQRHIELIAPSDMAVLISGETGTGKEFVAQSIHKFSKRYSNPFVVIDCGAMPRELESSELFGHMKGAFTGAEVDKQGSFEMADGGTLFLDEISNLSNDYQAKLLRILQERKIKRIGAPKDKAIDFRIIAATQYNPFTVVQEGKLREDLYHRLSEFKIHLSPLRERKEDILFFADYFLKVANETQTKHVTSFSQEARSYLTNYSWPGNLRELNNVVKRAVLLTTNDVAEVGSLPMEILDSKPTSNIEVPNNKKENNGMLKSIMWTAERQALVDILEKVGYDKSKAAQLLNIDKKALNLKLKLYSIE